MFISILANHLNANLVEKIGRGCKFGSVSTYLGRPLIACLYRIRIALDHGIYKARLGVQDDKRKAMNLNKLGRSV